MIEIFDTADEDLTPSRGIRVTDQQSGESVELTGQDVLDIITTLVEWVDDRERLARQIVLLFRRRSNLNLPVADLVEAGFDKVWHSEALEGIRVFSGGVGGPSTFSEIREAIAAVCETRWMEMYEQLQSHPGSPSGQSRASWWITNQKSAYRDGKLPDERVRLLEQLPWWKWTRTPMDRWMSMCKQIAVLIEAPAFDGRGQASAVYQWCGKQRIAYKRDSLSDQQIERLEAISWWVWDTGLDRWEQNYSALVKLDRLPRAAGKHGERDLYNWVHWCRQHRQNLTQEQVERLNALSFWTWNPKGAQLARWEEQFRGLAELGHKPRSTPRHGEQGLYDFMRSCIRRKDKLREEQVAKLESLEWWKW